VRTLKHCKKGDHMRLKSTILFFSLMILLALGWIKCRIPKPFPPLLPTPAKVLFAGVRSSSYGIKPFPEPPEWQSAMRTMSNYFEGSTPCAIWIVGEFQRPKDCRLYFPGDGKQYPYIQFEATDKHEKYLRFFDQEGIRVFLQVEPAQADLITLIDLVLERYKHHECVIGFGVDVEWYREFENPEWGVKVDDASAQQWEARVKFHNPRYRLFLKHWDRNWMPETYRGDIIFVDDSQIFKGFNFMVDEFVNHWANYFKPNPVFFQIGYRSDRPWWKKLNNPPKTIGDAIRKRIEQECGIFWVDFTLREVFRSGEK
jgi:hypothetical protein